MEEKLDAICDAMDFVELARKEIANYIDLEDIADGLSDLKSELLDEYRKTEEKLQYRKEVYIV